MHGSRPTFEERIRRETPEIVNRLQHKIIASNNLLHKCLYSTNDRRSIAAARKAKNAAVVALAKIPGAPLEVLLDVDFFLIRFTSGPNAGMGVHYPASASEAAVLGAISKQILL